MTTLKRVLGVSALSLAIVAAPLTSAFSDTAGHWVAEYLPTAIEEGAIDSSKPEFRPNANINRAELVKIVVNYDNGGDNPTADDYEAAAGFSDVTSSDWFYNHVNYAAEEGIVDGSKSTFRPAASMTRAEALKVITLALQVPSDSTKALPYGDVNEGDWYYSYVNNAFNNCIIKGASNFRPNDTITRAEAIKIFVASLTPGCETTSTPTPTATSTETATATTTTTSTTASSNTVEVVLNTSVDTSDVPKGGTNIDFLALDITAGSAEDVKLTGVTVYHAGHGDEADITDVKVFNGLAQAGNDKSFSGDDDVAAINLGSESIVIPAGTTKTVFVKADISGTAATGIGHGVIVADASGLSLYGVETGGAVAVSGSFPIAGPQREIANFNVGVITLEYKTVADSTLEVGTDAAEIANIKVSETSGEEDVWLKAITVELQGVDDGDFANLFVEVDGVVVSDVVASATSDDVTFDLTKADARGVLVEDSSNEYLYVKADITSQVDTFDANNGVKIDDASSDVVAVGARHGFDVAKSTIGVFSPITFEGGDFEFTLEGETGDIASDKDDVVLGTLTIENFGGAAEIQNTFKLNIVAGEGTGANLSAALGHIEDVTLVNTATGQIVFGPKTPDAVGDVLFNDTLVVDATSKLILEVQADINANAEDGETFKVQYTINAADVEGGPDLDDQTAVDLKPSAGVIDANNKTVSLPAVTFSGKSLGGDHVVESAENVVVWQGTVRANDVEDIKITRIGFKNTGTAGTSDINDYSLYATVNGTEEALETSVSSAATGTVFTFSSLSNGGLTVSKGEEITLTLKADIASTVTLANTIVINLDGASVQSKDEDGDFLTTVPADVASGATFTLVDAGSLAISLDASRSPDAAIALAGEELALAVYKFKATDEAAKVEDVVITVTETNSTVTGATANSAVDEVSLYYYDTGTAVLKTGGANATASVVSGVAFFEGLDLTIAEGTDTYIEVRALVDGIDENDSQQTADSGDAIKVGLTLTDARTDIKGNESGSAAKINGAAAPYANVDSSTSFLVLNNKLIATEVALTSTTLGNGTKEAVKFTLDAQGDNEVYLTALNVNVSATDLTHVTDLALYEGGKLLASSTAAATTTLTIGTCSVGTCDASTSGAEVVVKENATYVIKATFASVGADESASFEIAVNGADATATDGITWKDYGSDGTDNSTVSWIDLGSSSVTTISGTLSN